MTTAIQRRRGSTAEHAAFTGLLGEVTVDTTKKTLVVHDGVTAGGVPLARADADVAANAVTNTPSGNIAATTLQAAINELDTEKAKAGANSDITSLTTLSSINGGQIAGLRDRIINGDMRVARRGTSFGNAASYTLDRHFVSRAGSVAGVTASQVYSPFASLKSALRVQRDSGNASTAQSVISQPIEISNCHGLQGKTVTLSALIGTGNNLSSTTGHSLNVYYQTTGTDIGAAGAWTLISSTGFTLATSSGFVQKSGQFAVPSNATQLMTSLDIAYSGTAGADDSVYLTEIQLEIGSVATPFESRPYGLELALCERYLPSFVGVGNGYQFVGQCVNPTTARIVLPFRVTPRVAPTGAIVAAPTSGALWTASSAGVAFATAGFSTGTFSHGTLDVTITPTSLVAGDATLADIGSVGVYFTGCEL